MGVVERSEALYRRYLDDEDLAKLEAMDEPDRAYFWTYLYYEMPHRLNQSLLKEMEDAVLRGVMRKRVVIGIRQSVAKTLDDLWEPTKPHAWFKPSIGKEL